MAARLGRDGSWKDGTEMILAIWVRWIASVILLAVFLWVAVLNASMFWQVYFKGRKASSWIPLLGGSCGALALAISPVPQSSLLWWLPLLLDWGSVPGLLYPIILYLRKRKTRRRSSD